MQIALLVGVALKSQSDKMRLKNKIWKNHGLADSN